MNESAPISSNLASLVLVGSGIKFVSHLTTEAKAYIKESPKVLYLVNDPLMQLWIQKNNANAESLDSLYIKYPLRLQCYRAITEYILAFVRKRQHVCVVLYGHPTVFAQPGLAAIQQAKKEGFYTKVLPGISTEDCLFADLLIDPGSKGCQSYEATEFLLCQPTIELSSHLILWQVGVIGLLGHAQGKSHENKKGVTCLMEYLLSYYPKEHIVYFYEAAQYPYQEPKINQLALGEIASSSISRLTTLYIPPLIKKTFNSVMLKRLGIELEDLQ
jgi:uncharacterized protein YabN with tetrapyrrole methylase and pyrophosphatase domain